MFYRNKMFEIHTGHMYDIVYHLLIVNFALEVLSYSVITAVSIKSFPLCPACVVDISIDIMFRTSLVITACYILEWYH